MSYEDNEFIHHTGILLVNIRGCGYPPEVSCGQFMEKYAHHENQMSSQTFPCYYSRRNHSIVVPNFDSNHEKKTLWLSTIPVWIVMFASAVVALLIKSPWQKKEENEPPLSPER